MMINEFIDKIIVHAPEKVDGDRVQEVEIYLKFIGQFELPAPKLTEEEIKRQEQLKRHHIQQMQGICLSKTYAEYGYRKFSNILFCCSPTPKPCPC